MSELRVILLIGAGVVLHLTATTLITYEIAHGTFDSRSVLMVVLFSLMITICIAGAMREIRDR